ncbi:helix-turn-helix domain-containing protein [Verminephrobacter aporrectodeae subsp. tuberculatae]|nr:helix-turn-helix domain-containing protein [Verminephrobacter aporrectodeae subsp. tuberculatae]MCW5289983.1 helix-turn-helix domain-containing protein [Verminephrobacter aporrectodeae subsp. tuberculatae]
MISLEDRQAMAQSIHTAHTAGARLRLACKTAGIDLRTLQRWQAHAGLTAGDGRPQAVRPLPSHALSPHERAQLLAVANEPRFADMPPARIVPMLADEGVYLASESSFARVLRAHGQNTHRGRAKAVHAKVVVASCTQPTPVPHAGSLQCPPEPGQLKVDASASVPCRPGSVRFATRPAAAPCSRAILAGWPVT